MTKYWVGVASYDHIQKGMDGNFCQVCHGKSIPLKRMKKGDWMVYYSPKVAFSGKEPLRAFTAIGEVVDEEVYPFQMTPDFIPFRRNMVFLPNTSFLPIKEVLEELSFITDKSKYGYQFRFGHFEIPQEDFLLIHREMMN
ncbi:EVE domain-containing protein [Isobaculum melis]|uniref:UPF0310 protein SAMN04488559_10927 n=1 Tax=Isobaculum melis TaxID=142588 RepID=A0A1H9STH6_9LACT|nr:EVE domain-containing protein [Isobaculum melis]SER88198.1 EVE domain-containing protein [Isobaculum melis]